MNATVLLDGTSIDPGSVGGKGSALNRLIGMGATVRTETRSRPWKGIRQQ
jgi:hypothetical protein